MEITKMKWIFLYFTSSMTICVVLAAPSTRTTSKEEDAVEQELIRNHHSAALRRLKSEIDQASSETDESFPVKSIQRIPDTDDASDRSFSEDDLYDITVGDVIRDVLLTLRDHPEIVKQLIASEKAKLAEQIDAFNSLVDGDSAGDNLAGFMQPSEQLNLVPKTVEKKDGHSRMNTLSGQKTGNKRTDEIINDEYARAMDVDDSAVYSDFMEQPNEGGEDDSMFDLEESESTGSDSNENDSDFDSNGDQISNSENRNEENNSDTKSDEEPVQHTEDNSKDLNSEEELAWLLHNGHIRNSDKSMKQKAMAAHQ